MTVYGYSNKKIKTINLIDTRSKIKDRIKQIEELSGIFRFVKTESSIFGNNLDLIDSSLSKIMSEILHLFFISSLSRTKDLVAEISKKNPLSFSTEGNQPFYEYKVKRFLTDVALGMMPSKVWTGKLDATGGYLVVREDGEILCYHIYNRNEFEDYLFSNTKLETASSSRHDFGKVFRSENQLYFKLNLQIRFTR